MVTKEEIDAIDNYFSNIREVLGNGLYNYFFEELVEENVEEGYYYYNKVRNNEMTVKEVYQELFEDE